MGVVEAPAEVSYEITSGKEDPVTYTIGDWTHTTGSPRVLARDILVIPSAVPDLMDQLVDAADKLHRWKSPTVVRGDRVTADLTFRKCEAISVNKETHKSLHPFEAITKGLAALWADLYRCHVNPHMTTNRVESQVQLLRYWPGMFFKEHTDAIQYNDALAARRLSFIAFRAHELCEGGALVFRRQGYAFMPDGRVYKWHRKTSGPLVSECEDVERHEGWRQVMPASKGTAILMPSGPAFPHWKQPVIKGGTESLVKWYH